jgi:hypothetical protein
MIKPYICWIALGLSLFSTGLAIAAISMSLVALIGFHHG